MCDFCTGLQYFQFLSGESIVRRLLRWTLLCFEEADTLLSLSRYLLLLLMGGGKERGSGMEFSTK